MIKEQRSLEEGEWHMLYGIFGILLFLGGALVGYEAFKLWTTPVHVGIEKVSLAGWVLAVDVPEAEIVKYIISFLILSGVLFLASLYLFKRAWLKQS
jgi:hypothetical protein